MSGIALGQKSEIARAVVRQVWHDSRQFAVTDAEPATQRSAELVDRDRRQQSTLPNIIRPVVGNRWCCAVERLSADGTADHKVHAAPAMVGAVAIGIVGPAEVGGGEGGDGVGDAHFDGGVVEGLHRIGHVGQQVCVRADGGVGVVDLIVMQIPATDAGEEDLPLQTEGRAGRNQARDRAQLLGEIGIGEGSVGIGERCIGPGRARTEQRGARRDGPGWAVGLWLAASAAQKLKSCSPRAGGRRSFRFTTSEQFLSILRRRILEPCSNNRPALARLASRTRPKLWTQVDGSATIKRGARSVRGRR